MSKIEQFKIEKARITEALLQAILDDPELSKLEKLMKIEETESLPFHIYLFRPLEKKYTNIFKAQIEEKNGVQNYHIIDSWPLIDVDHLDRGERVSLASQLENTIENAAWDLVGDNPSEELVYKEEVVVLRNRSIKAPDEYNITVGQLIDDVYEWVVSNRYIGFTFDW